MANELAPLTGLLSNIAQNVVLDRLRKNNPLFRLQVQAAKENILTAQQTREIEAEQAAFAEEQAPLTRQLTQLQITGERQRQKLEGEAGEREELEAPIDRALAQARADLITAQRSGIQKEIDLADKKLKLEEERVQSETELSRSRARLADVQAENVLTIEDRIRLKKTPSVHIARTEGGEARLGPTKILSNAERVQQLTELREQLKPFFKDPTGGFLAGDPEDEEVFEVARQISAGDFSNVREEKLQEFMYNKPYFDYFVEIMGRGDVAANQPGTTDAFKLRVGSTFRAVSILNSLSDGEWEEYKADVRKGDVPPYMILELISQKRDLQSKGILPKK